MASAVAFTFALLATSALAAPSRPISARQGLSAGASAVNDNIDGWQADIANVNGFLNTAASGVLSGTQLAQSASELLVDQPGTAADEPNRLMALAGLINTADATAEAAVSNLMEIFPGVLGNLTTIVDNPGDIATINSAVEQINCLRYVSSTLSSSFPRMPLY